MRPEQPRLAQFPVHREHDLGAYAGHRLEVNRGGMLTLVKRPYTLRPQVVAPRARLDDARPPAGVVMALPAEHF
jgi:hypothetical protein